MRDFLMLDILNNNLSRISANHTEKKWGFHVQTSPTSIVYDTFTPSVNCAADTMFSFHQTEVNIWEVNWWDVMLADLSWTHTVWVKSMDPSC